MKRILALILVAMMALTTFVACNNETPNNDNNNDNGTEAPAGDATDAPADGETEAPVVDSNVNSYKVVDGSLGYYFFEKFVEIKKADSTKNAEAVVNEIMATNLGTTVQFPMVMPVEPGYLTGFNLDKEFSGFATGAMFGSGMMGVAFIGYVFDLAEDADVKAFMKSVEDNVDPRWNQCTEAEMITIGAYKNSVILVMCPAKAPSSISGIADIVEPTVTAGSASETLWNEFKTVMAGNPAMIAAQIVDALAQNAFKGEVTYVEEYSFENKDVFTYTIEGFNNASYITSGDKLVYVIQLDEGMDVANWMSYYFDGIKAASSAYGAYNNTMIVMVNVG